MNNVCVKKKTYDNMKNYYLDYCDIPENQRMNGVIYLQKGNTQYSTIGNEKSHDFKQINYNHNLRYLKRDCNCSK